MFHLLSFYFNFFYHVPYQPKRSYCESGSKCTAYVLLIKTYYFCSHFQPLLVKAQLLQRSVAFHNNCLDNIIFSMFKSIDSGLKWTTPFLMWVSYKAIKGYGFLCDVLLWAKCQPPFTTTRCALLQLHGYKVGYCRKVFNQTERDNGHEFMVAEV